MFILDIGTVPTVCYCVLVIVISFALECYTGYTLTLQRKFSMLDGAIHKSNSTMLISYYFGNGIESIEVQYGKSWPYSFVFIQVCKL
jgi:hypothetical protein